MLWIPISNQNQHNGEKIILKLSIITVTISNILFLPNRCTQTKSRTEVFNCFLDFNLSNLSINLVPHIKVYDVQNRHKMQNRPHSVVLSSYLLKGTTTLNLLSSNTFSLNHGIIQKTTSAYKSTATHRSASQSYQFYCDNNTISTRWVNHYNPFQNNILIG